MKRFVIFTIMAIFSTAAMAQTFPDTLRMIIEGKIKYFPIISRSED